jgi:hypothetical protein
MKTSIKRVFFIGALFLFFYNATAQSITSSLPKKINPKSKYIFYLHGRIVEEQGVNAVHNEHGRYEYQKILDTLKNAGFNIISEVRPKDTDPEFYANKVINQIDSLLKAKVAPENITVVGASKGAWITIFISSKLKNAQVNFVIMGTCRDNLNYSLDEFQVCGNILSIYEKSDPWGSSCQKLFGARDCLGKYKEIELNLGLGHGFLYKPYKEWVIPTIEWANENQKKKKVKK